MKLYALLLAAVLLHSACDDTGTGGTSAADSDTSQISQPPASVVNPRGSSWRATVIKGSGKGKDRLQVTGLIKVKDKSPRTTLTPVKQTGAIDISALVLNVSQEPAKDGEAVPVSYQETLVRSDKYRKVTIMHKGATIATIDTIESK